MVDALPPEVIDSTLVADSLTQTIGEKVTKPFFEEPSWRKKVTSDDEFFYCPLEEGWFPTWISQQFGPYWEYIEVEVEPGVWDYYGNFCENQRMEIPIGTNLRISRDFVSPSPRLTRELNELEQKYAAFQDSTSAIIDTLKHTMKDTISFYENQIKAIIDNCSDQGSDNYLGIGASLSRFGRANIPGGVFTFGTGDLEFKLNISYFDVNDGSHTDKYEFPAGSNITRGTNETSTGNMYFLAYVTAALPIAKGVLAGGGGGVGYNESRKETKIWEGIFDLNGNPVLDAQGNPVESHDSYTKKDISRKFIFYLDIGFQLTKGSRLGLLMGLDPNGQSTYTVEYTFNGIHLK